jgi:prephenate dehydrogenase
VKQGWDKVIIVGAGLLGGSLGLALKKHALASRIVGVGRRQSSLDTALEQGAIDEGSLDLAEACAEADLIVLCTPAAQVPGQLDTVREAMKPSAVTTDVASTKAAICNHARQTWPQPQRFIGSHPIAGSEKFGPEHAFAELYEDKAVIMETGDHLDPDAEAQVRGLWTALGSRLVDVDPETHDAVVARTSHIPHLLSSCLAELAAGAGDVKDLIGSGFRDVTRVAEGRPEIWRDICLTNDAAILDGLDDLATLIQEARHRIAQGDRDGLDEFFQSAWDARRKVVD